MQSENGFMDQVARLMTNAAGAAKGLRDEFATMAKTRAEKIANDLELVPREEFEAMKTIAMKARAETEALRARVEALENRLFSSAAAASSSAATTSNSNPNS